MATETKVTHTPGPWQQERFCAETYIVRTAPEALGCGQCIVAEMRRYPEAPYEWMANARLISAAPDLLEAAQEAWKWFKDNGGANHPDAERLATAIAKAEGK